MVDFDRVVAVKEAARERLLSLPGVHAVGVGPKIVANKRTGIPAIIVLVVEKRKRSELASDEIIPTEIDGVKTDIVESSVPILGAGSAVDEDTKKERPIIGGTQILPGGFNIGGGTLGCLAEASDKSRVFAVTNWHVLGLPPGHGTTFDASASTLIDQLSTNPESIILSSRDNTTFIGPKHSKALASFRVVVLPEPGVTNNYDFTVETTRENETFQSLADKLADKLRSVPGTTVTTTVPQDGKSATITITPPPGTAINLDCHAIGVQLDINADLNATVAGNTITLTGNASGLYYGIYTTIYVGGALKPTQGAFTQVKKDMSLATIASFLASALNQAGSVGGIVAHASGAVVTVDGADAIECVIWKDIRVGQPNSSFGSCCSDRIGLAFSARRDLDIALIQLDPGLKYLAEIKDIGFVTGTHPVTDLDAMTHLSVRKRGKATRETIGHVVALHQDGFASEPVPEGQGQGVYFTRRYTDAMTIIEDDANGPPMVAPGDSGSAVVHVEEGPPRTTEVVGFAFAGPPANRRGVSVVTPIQAILGTFPIQIATATQLGDVRTVPPLPGGQAQAANTLSEKRAGEAVEAMPWIRIDEVEREIASTPSGRACVEMVRRHGGEAIALVNKNRRVGVAWQRNGGPLIVKGLLHAIQDAASPIPPLVMGKPLQDSIEAIGSAFRAHGSPALVADLERLERIVASLDFAGKTYADVLAQLGSQVESGTPARRREDRRPQADARHPS